MMLRFHTQTAGSTLTAQQPEVNVVRTTVQALAAVLGGTQSLHTNSMDEALSLPTETAARIALRTQQVIANESGACDTVDPLGGAPFIEALTDELESKALAIMSEVDRRGGPVAAIESGYVQREIQKSAMAWLRAVESGNETPIWDNLNRDAQETWEACGARDAYGRVLNMLGWCYGRQGEAGVDMNWHRCQANSNRMR